MNNSAPIPPAAGQAAHTQALDDFCADAIRRMRGMKSFNGIGVAGAAARGRALALRKFKRTLRQAFPALTENEVFTLRCFANDRVHEWTTTQTARAALALAQGGCEVSRAYRQTARRHEDADEAARQRGLAAQQANYAHAGLPGPQSSFSAFATDLTKTNALVLSKPCQLFGIPALPDPVLAASVADEYFSEGRQHRPAPAPINYEDES